MFDFKLPSTSGVDFELSKCSKPLVLFFYPRDNTSGCTVENQDFAKLYPKFIKLGFEVLGISRDTLKSHHNFKNKYNLPFDLLADPEENVCNMFSVMKDKKMYGKPVRGIERSTFIFDKKKSIIKEWRKVSVDGHAQMVLDYIKTL